MQDPYITLTIALASLIGLAMLTNAMLRGWRDWISLKRLEMENGHADQGGPSPASRIEIADLKERIRKLEAIAAGVDM